MSWHALFAPSATPKDIVQRLNAEMNAIMGDPDMQQRIAAMGLMPVGTPPLAEVETFIVTERDKWGALIRKLGLEGTQ